MARIVTGLAVSLDGYIAGPDDGLEQPLGRRGQRLFEWYTNGDTPSRLYPSFRLSKESAEFFDDVREPVWSSDHRKAHLRHFGGLER